MILSEAAETTPETPVPKPNCLDNLRYLPLPILHTINVLL